MTIFSPTAETSVIEGNGWNHTFVDGNSQIPAGSVNAIGVYSLTPATLTVKIAELISGSTFKIVVSETFSHTGTGWEDHTLASPFASNGSGHYLSCHTPIDINKSVATARRFVSGNLGLNSQAGFYADSAPIVAIRAIIDEEAPAGGGGSPGPSPSSTHYLHLFAGQSNGLALASGAGGAAFLASMNTLVPHASHQIVNACVGSSFIAQPSEGERHWQPTPGDGLGTLCQDAVNAVSAAKAATPNSVLASIQWYQGEAQTRHGRGESIIRYPEFLSVTLNAISEPNVPVNVVELHAQPDGSYQIWSNMQWMQRQFTDPASDMYVANTQLVSASDMSDSTDGGLHLTEAALTVVGQRLAEATAKRIWPR
jgi:hypothetical protein